MLKKIAASFAALSLPLAVRAQNLGVGTLDDAATKYAGYQPGTSPEAIIGNIIKVFLALIGTIFFVLMVYGGYNWMIARGDEGRVETAKSTITRAIIGLVITMGAYAITYFIVDRVIAGGMNTQ